MDKIKAITKERLSEIAANSGFGITLINKDYFVTLILYLLRDMEGIYFKGGTALNKIYLNHARLSEDVDFTVTENVEKAQKRITSMLNESNIFEKFTKDKDVGGFVRIIAHYKGFSGEDGTVFIDLNQRGKPALKPEKNKIHHFYEGFIPEFSINTVSKEEMIAEKVAAAIGRNKPRDHYDIYQILKRDIPINLEIVKKKCEDSGYEFSIVKMFDNANKLHNRWNDDMTSLLAEDISFKDVMTFLAKHFKLKEEKEILKDKK